MSSRLLLTLIGFLVVAGCRGSADTLLMRVQVEMPGAKCAAGGVSIQSGPDGNGSGVLDDDEVTADLTRIVCNGTNGTNGTVGMNGMTGSSGDAGVNGLNALSQVTAEPSGANCTYGGARVDVGIDTDGNGMLAASEISATRYICDHASIDAIYFGDLRLRDDDDLAQLDNVQVVSGNLTIESVDGGALVLPKLRIVSGNISLGFQQIEAPFIPSNLTSLSMPELTQAGRIFVNDEPLLTTLSLPRLERATEVSIQNDDLLASVVLTELRRVDLLTFNFNPVLPVIDLPALEATEEFVVYYHYLLTRVAAPNLRAAKNWFNVASNYQLPDCNAVRLLTHLTRKPRSSNVTGNSTSTACMGTDVCHLTPVMGVSNPLWSCEIDRTQADSATLCGTLGMGAGLAWVESDAEWMALSAAAAARTVTGGWFGYSDAAMEGTWVRLIGPSMYDPTARMDFWAPNEPGGTTAENFSELMSNGLANDLAALAQRHSICRVP